MITQWFEQYPELARGIGTALILLGAFLLQAVLKAKLHRIFERIRFPRLAFQPVKLLLQGVVYFAALLVVFSLWELQVLKTLLATLASFFALVAVGFVALWSVASNFLCTFMLIVFKPFSIGDEVEFPVDAIKGRVVDLNLMFTRLEDGEGNYIQIPNSTFFLKMFKGKTSHVRIKLEEQLAETKPFSEGRGE